MKKSVILFILIFLVVFSGCNNSASTSVEINESTEVLEKTEEYSDNISEQQTTPKETEECSDNISEQQTTPKETEEYSDNISEQQTTEQIGSVYEERAQDYYLTFDSVDDFKSFLNPDKSKDILKEQQPNQDDIYYNIMLELPKTLSGYSLCSFESDVAKIKSIKVEKKMTPDFIKWFDSSYEFEYTYVENISPVKVAVYIPLSQYKEILEKEGLTAYYTAFSNAGVPGNFNTEFYRDIEDITVTIDEKEYHGLYVDVLSDEKSDFIELAYGNLMLRFELFGDRVNMPFEENIEFVESFYATIINS